MGMNCNKKIGGCIDQDAAPAKYAERIFPRAFILHNGIPFVNGRRDYIESRLDK